MKLALVCTAASAIAVQSANMKENPPDEPVKVCSDCASGKPNRVTDFYGIVMRVSRRATPKAAAHPSRQMKILRQQWLWCRHAQVRGEADFNRPAHRVQR